MRWWRSARGCPAGVEVTTADIAAALARRRAGYGRGARMKFEQDEVEITGGVRHGRTLGGAGGDPDRQHRVAEMGDGDVARPGAGRGAGGPGARNAPLTRPRPGHADLAGMQKYGHDDARPVLERASARETAARVALGEVATAVPAPGVRHRDRQPRGGDRAGARARGQRCRGRATRARVDADPVRCLDPAASAAMRAEIDAARKDGDTLGGVVEVVAYGLPPGLGSHVHWDRRLDARLAGALMSIQAIKGVEVGDGFATARRRGSQAHDEIEQAGGRDPAADQPGRRDRGRHEHRRGAAGAGGDEADLHRAARAGHRGRAPPARPAKAINQRSDVTAVPAAGVVAEAMVGAGAGRRGGREVRRRLGRRGRAATCAATWTRW